MKIFVCPKYWISCYPNRFEPDYLLSLQDPGADVSDLRPDSIPANNHQIFYFYDMDIPTEADAPSREVVQGVINWLLPHCAPGSEKQMIIHCDAGLGRSPAVAYIAWSIHLGAGRELEAFQRMKGSCRETCLIPNSIVVAHADEILGRGGALKKPLTEWNRKVSWCRTHR